MPLFLGENKISKISVAVDSADGGINTSDATLTSGAQMLSGVTAYSNGKKYTGTIATVTAPSPTISVSSDGIVTANVSNPKGYQSSATTKSTTQQLTTKSATTVTPSDVEQTIVNSGVYTTGEITVSAVPTETKSITANGTFAPTTGKYFSSVTVNVPSETTEISLQEKTVTPNESTQTVSFDDGYDGLSTVTVNPISSTYIGSSVPTKSSTTITPSSSSQIVISSGTYATGDIMVSAVPTETKEITANGTYTPTSGKWFSSVNVNVAGDTFSTQTKSIIPNESEQIVTPDNGYDGLSSVTVEAISSTYVGSGVATKGATIITPSTSGQIAVSSGTYVTGNITVDAMPNGELSTPTLNTNTGVVTAGVSTSGYLSTSATKTLQLTTKSAATYTPGTSDQTIVSGQYLTGAQTIQGDTNLVSENIISGKSIFGVSGSVVIQKYYTGSDEPSSSLGNDGDLYLKV